MQVHDVVRAGARRDKAPFLVGIATDLYPLLNERAVGSRAVRVIEDQATVQIHDVVRAVARRDKAPFLVGVTSGQCPLLHDGSIRR